VKALVCHPHTPTAAVQGIDVDASRAAGGLLALSYTIRGPMHRLRIPAPRAPGVGERLWQHSCCEAFVAAEPGAAYRELNFSPSGEWAAYAFERYREGAPVGVADPRIRIRSGPGELRLEASIAVKPGKHFVALCVVVEDDGGALSYWALRHPPGKPDFHHPAGFALELD
jgi:hypothetical protein